MDETIPKMLKRVTNEYPENPIQFTKDKTGNFVPITYRAFFETALDFAAALLDIGVSRGDTIGIISDNRAEWQQADVGIMSIGAVDVPRGCDATVLDIRAILGITECKITIAENTSQVNKILSIKEDTENAGNENLPHLVKIIMFDCPTREVTERAEKNNVELFLFSEVLKRGKRYRIEHKGVVESELEKGGRDDLACIIFTSGTTGSPKGVELTEKNFITQLDEIPERVILNPGDKVISVLPVWHVYERTCEYIMFIQGAAVCYSKPIGSILLKDMAKLNPTLIPAVPRIFEAVYDGIMRKMRETGGVVYALFKFFVKVAIIHSRMQRLMFNRNSSFTRYYTVLWWFLFLIPWTLLWPLKLLGNLIVFRKIKLMFGKKFRAGVVGGGSYPQYIDEFFWAIGVKVIEGYGITETSPIVSVRPYSRPIFGNVGSPVRGVKARIVSPDDGFVLKRGEFGAIQVKGDTVMRGYYKNEELTRKAISSDGWFDTGDLGMMTIHDEIIIKGRKKDTIVLRGGENVEPVPIEMKLSQSKFIAQAVIVGQDQKSLGALILVNNDEVKNYAAENGIPYESYEALLNSEVIQKLFESELNFFINPKNGFKIYERVNKFALLTKPFEVGVELSAKQDIMRYRITQIYKKEIEGIFSE